MILVRKCVVCGVEFSTKWVRKITCSPPCAKLRLKETSKIFREQNQVHIQERQKEYKQKNREALRAEGRKYYHKNKDRYHANKKIYRQKNKVLLKQKAKEYDRKRQEKIEQENKIAIVCVICGNVFYSHLKHKQTCSNECLKTRKKWLKKKWLEKNFERLQKVKKKWIEENQEKLKQYKKKPEVRERQCLYYHFRGKNCSLGIKKLMALVYLGKKITERNHTTIIEKNKIKEIISHIQKGETHYAYNKTYI